MKFKRYLALFLAGMLLVSLAACKGGKDQEASSSASEPEIPVDPNYPVAIGDIRVAEKPKRVVSLSPALTEVICELGAEDRLVGVSDFCDYPDSVNALPRCGTPQLPKDAEIRELSPQVIFCSSMPANAELIKMQQAGAEVVVLPPAQNVEGIGDIYGVVGTILDGMEDGAQNGAETFAPLKAKYDAIAAAAATVEKRWTGCWLRATPLMMATGDTFEGTLLETIGVDNAAKEFTGWEYPADKAVDLYPDLLFYDETVDVEYLKTNQVYNTTDAVKQGRMYPFHSVAIERQSAGFFSELEKMFRAAYPDVELPETAPPAEPEPDAAPDASSEAPAEQESSASPDDGDMLSLDDATKIIQ